MSKGNIYLLILSLIIDLPFYFTLHLRLLLAYLFIGQWFNEIFFHQENRMKVPITWLAENGFYCVLLLLITQTNSFLYICNFLGSCFPSVLLSWWQALEEFQPFIYFCGLTSLPPPSHCCFRAVPLCNRWSPIRELKSLSDASFRGHIKVWMLLSVPGGDGSGSWLVSSPSQRGLTPSSGHIGWPFHYPPRLGRLQAREAGQGCFFPRNLSFLHSQIKPDSLQV